MTTSDWVTVIGWLATFLLGVLSTLLVARKLRDKKIISWGTVSEAELVPAELSDSLAVPVEIQVGGNPVASLSAVTLRIKQLGNVVVKDLEPVIRLNPGSHLVSARLASDLGEYGRYVSISEEAAGVRIRCEFINPGRRIDVELLVAGYEPGSAQVDLAAPGVTLERFDPSRPYAQGIARSMALGLMGVRYEPTVLPMLEIVEELRGIRRQLHSLQEARK